MNYNSNHGGRNLDTSPPALLTLLELQHSGPDIFQIMEVYVDGGITRGTEILKALCLGAKGVLMVVLFYMLSTMERRERSI